MKLTAIHLERYRALKEPLRLEIRPMTVLIGKNSSGKSMLARLPVLLARALSDQAESPLDLVFDEFDFGGRYNDLVYGRTPHGYLILGVEAIDNTGKTILFRTRLQHFHEKEALAITEFVFEYDGTVVVKFTANLSTLWTLSPMFVDQTGIEGSINFFGIYPRQIDSVFGHEVGKKIIDGLKVFQRVLEAPTYLGPFRDVPQRNYPSAPQVLRSIGTRGERAGAFLADDHFRHSGDIARAVADWYENFMRHQRLEVQRDGSGFSLIVQDVLRNVVGINLVDTGTGLAQILPVVVLKAALDTGRLKASAVIVEQPELHLHPAVHGDVCDLFLGLAQSGTPCIVETHSESFIMRLRRRIAIGDFAASGAILHSVDHDDPRDDNTPYVTGISIDERGKPSTWPQGVFEEVYRDVVEISKANRERR